MAPLRPHWVQPSHPEIQEVIVTGNAAEFTTKSISKVAVPPFGLFAKLEFPPCTVAPEATYATVQMGRDKHLDLNSDLLYINHSCEPSLIFDTASMNVIAGPKGLQPGDELTFFYPSTEWYMAQPFDCLCGTLSCRGRIAGARDMTSVQLDGLWLNGHIRELLEERERGSEAGTKPANGVSTTPPSINGNANDNHAGNGIPKAPAENSSTNGTNGTTTNPTTALPDQTVLALRDALTHAEKVVDAARLALVSYVEALQLAGLGTSFSSSSSPSASNGQAFGSEDKLHAAKPAGAQRRGPTSRELSGEMGGDTSVSV